MKDEGKLKKLDEALRGRTSICSSEGIVHSFPDSLKVPYNINGIGLIVCRKGCFRFKLNGKVFSAHEGETVFIPEYSSIYVMDEEDGLEISVLVYQIEPIRDIMGNMVLSMYPYSRLSDEPCYVWKTGEEEEVMRYMSMIDSTTGMYEEDDFVNHERKLLLLALTHRLCSIYSRKLFGRENAVGHKHEVFMKLVELVENNYMKERGVEFYADKLCLSAKYLSFLSKSISGYTVQELVFKAITRKSISLLNNTQKSIQEISDELNFPNASYFGTFFKKQVGCSPLKFRNKSCE